MVRSNKRGTIRNQLKIARSTLTAAHVGVAWLDAEVLLAHVLGHDRPWLHAHPECPLTTVEGRRFHRLVERRSEHEPVAYLTGEREFYGHRLRVSPAVLIPRPETELIVELAVDWLLDHPQARRVIDLGTGSGAIAIALARAVPSIRVTAIDNDTQAVALAAENVTAHRVASRVDVRCGDLLTAAPAADLIAANLPYLSATRLRHGAPELAYEPARALDGGRDGLDVIRRAIAQAPSIVRPGGGLLFECDPPQAHPIEQLAKRGWTAPHTIVHKDLAGRDRVVQILL